jgi:glycosyltransferase involved in cell wall biosynthesis
MKIAMVGQKGIPATYGGIERHVEELACRLVERGHDVSVYCRMHYTRTRGFHRGVRLVRYPSIPTKHLDAISHTGLVSLDSVFRDVDIVHFHALGPSIFSMLPRLMGKKTVTTVHGLDWQREKWGAFAQGFLRFCEKPAARFPNKCIVVSKTLREYFAERHGLETVFIPNGTLMPELKRPDKLRKLGLAEGRYILFVGRIVPEKGCHYLVEAFNQLDTDAKLVMVGGSSFSDGYVDTVKRLAEGNDRILFLDYVYGDLLDELWSNAYFVVQPSVLEGLSIALLEALSFGKCVVVSDIPENMEVVEDCAISFRSRDVTDLRDKMDQLLHDPTLVGSFEERCRRLIEENYSWEVVVSALEALYHEISDQGGDALATAGRELPRPDVPSTRATTSTRSVG